MKTNRIYYPKTKDNFVFVIDNERKIVYALETEYADALCGLLENTMHDIIITKNIDKAIEATLKFNLGSLASLLYNNFEDHIIVLIKNPKYNYYQTAYTSSFDIDECISLQDPKHTDLLLHMNMRTFNKNKNKDMKVFGFSVCVDEDIADNKVFVGGAC